MLTSSGRSPWTPATSPSPAPETAPELLTVEPALLTGFERGRLAVSGDFDLLWLRGAVHDGGGRLVPSSQRTWDGDRRSIIAADPKRVPVPSEGPSLEGTWLYVGHWPRHFGHFLLETLTNLWPERPALDGLVAHRRFHGPVPLRGDRTGGPRKARVFPYQKEMLRLVGYGGLPVQQVEDIAVRVERLLVPTRPVVLKSWADRSAVEVWQRMASEVEAGPDERVFLSRRLFHETFADRESRFRQSAEWEDQMEKVFVDHGFRLVHPETMTVREQIAIVKGARVLAGSCGSALHQSVFARPGTHVLEVGDLRSPTAAMPTQRMVDAACGHVTAFCDYGDLAGLRRTLACL